MTTPRALAALAGRAVVYDPQSFWCAAPHAEGYDHGRFDNLKGRVYRQAEERALAKAIHELEPGSRVLDAACGTGRVGWLLHRAGFSVVGCDISVAMMTVARRRLGGVPFLQTDVTALPFATASFDAVTCVGLLMHLDRGPRVQALRELARISRGLIVVQYGCLGPFQRLQSWVTGRPAGGVRYPVEQGEVRRDLRRSGLTEVSRYWALRPFSSSLILVLSK
jgi:SAM-dependent methyltransferase